MERLAAQEEDPIPPFDREEVESAYQHFVEVGDSGDWNAWADLHTEDCLWF